MNSLFKSRNDVFILNKKVSVLFLAKKVFVLLTLVFLIVFLNFENGLNIKEVDLLCLLIPMFLIFSNFIISKSFFSLSNLFNLLLSIFHFGLYWLDLFGMNIDSSFGYNLFALYSDELLISAAVFCLQSLLYLNIGIILLGKEIRHSTKFAINSRMIKIAKTIFYILLPIMLFNDFYKIYLTNLYSYSQAVYMFSFLDRFEICLYLSGLACASKNFSLKNNYIIFLSIRSILLMLLTGSRIMYLLEIVFCFYFISGSLEVNKRIKVSLFKLLFYGVILYILACILAYTRMTRGSFDASFLDYLFSGGVLNSLLSEFGSTMITMVLAVKHDQIGRFYGLTYLSSALTLIPFSTRLFPFISYFRVAHDFLNPFSPSVGTLGGSYFAEQFMNFSFNGVLLSVPFGFFIKFLENKYLSASKAINKLLLFSLWIGIVILARANFYDFISNVNGIIYFVILYWGIGRLLAKRNA